MSGDMHACVIFSTLVVLSICVTLHQIDPANIISKSKVELKPILVSCTLSDIVVISAPIIQNALYYLYNPNGDCRKLNLTRPAYDNPSEIVNNEYDNIIIQHKSHFKGIIPVNNYQLINVLDDSESTEFGDETKNMKANDFMIGPLLSDDHGNWVLSAYYQDINGDWIETFQVITIEITEYVPPNPKSPHLKPGDTFEFSFAYPIRNLSSCELTAPKSTFDRFYERNQIDMETCGYVIKNVTYQDRGFWRIRGVGKIVHGTQVYLEIEKPK